MGHALGSLVSMVALSFRRHYRALRKKRPPLEDMLWAWSGGRW